MSRVLLNGSMIPLTFSWGFLDIPLKIAGKALLEWHKQNFPGAWIENFNGSLEFSLKSLEPLTIPPTKELLISTKSKWISYFDNGAQGGEPATVIGYLCEKLKCNGIAVSCIPNSSTKVNNADRTVYGAVILDLFGPNPTDWLNYERSIGILNDGGKWVFINRGHPMRFEDSTKYTAKRIRDRFNDEMLALYASELGIDLFTPGFYGQEALIVEVQRSIPFGAPSFTIEEAQKHLGFR